MGKRVLKGGKIAEGGRGWKNGRGDKGTARRGGGIEKGRTSLYREEGGGLRGVVREVFCKRKREEKEQINWNWRGAEGRKRWEEGHESICSP